MFKSQREIDAARRFDGEGDAGQPLSEADAAYMAQLQRLRDGVSAVKDTPAISDAQFSAFMAGIREGIDAPVQRGWGRFWSVASLTAAALLVSLSLFALFMNGGTKVHTVVEAATTEIPGAKVDVYDSNDGYATVWVTYSEGDIW